MSAATRFAAKLKQHIETVGEPGPTYRFCISYRDLTELVVAALKYEQLKAALELERLRLSDCALEKEIRWLRARCLALQHDLGLAEQRVQAANAQLVAQAEHQAGLETELTRMVERDYFEHKALFAQAVSRCVDAAASCLPPTGTDGWYAAQRTIVDRIAAVEFEP